MNESDLNLKKLLLTKVTPELSDDLDERIMNDINETVERQKAGKRSLILSWIFLTIAAVTGVAIPVTRIVPGIDIRGFSGPYIALIFRVICALIILLLFDRLYRLTFEIKNKATLL